MSRHCQEEERVLPQCYQFLCQDYLGYSVVKRQDISGVFHDLVPAMYVKLGIHRVMHCSSGLYKQKTLREYCLEAYKKELDQ